MSQGPLIKFDTKLEKYTLSGLSAGGKILILKSGPVITYGQPAILERGKTQRHPGGIVHVAAPCRMQGGSVKADIGPFAYLVAILAANQVDYVGIPRSTKAESGIFDSMPEINLMAVFKLVGMIERVDQAQLIKVCFIFFVAQAQLIENYELSIERAPGETCLDVAFPRPAIVCIVFSEEIGLGAKGKAAGQITPCRQLEAILIRTVGSAKFTEPAGIPCITNAIEPGIHRPEAFIQSRIGQACLGDRSDGIKVAGEGGLTLEAEAEGGFFSLMLTSCLRPP